MISGKFIKIDEIVERLYEMYPFVKDVSKTDIANLSAEILALLSARNTLQEEGIVLTIEDYRAELPSNIVQLKAVRDHCSKVPLTYTTDNFSFLVCDDSVNRYCSCKDTYRVNPNFIYTSFKEGEIDMVYTGFPIDDEGYPMIPDDESFKMAIEYHCAKRLAQKAYFSDQLSRDKYQELKQEASWYAGQAKNKAEIPSVDLMEAIKNSKLRLIQKINMHGQGFKELGTQERRVLHNVRRNNGDIQEHLQ
jgi:hypothetical protein